MTLNILMAEAKRIGIVILTSTLIYLASPFFTVYFSFFWLLRYFLTLWKKICHPELGPLLGGLDSVMLSESPYTTAQQLSACYYVTVQGKIELEEFRTVVRNGLKTYSQDNETSRRLSQFLTKWVGYFVGQDEKNFRVQDHVRILDVEELNERFLRQCGPKAVEILVNKKIHNEHFTDDEVAQLNWSLMKVPYEENTSPWEMLILYNPQPESESESKSETVKRKETVSTGVETKRSNCTTVIISRMHHCLSDGKAWISLFSHFFDQGLEYSYGRTVEFFDSSKNKNTNGTWLQKISQNCTHFILGLPAFISHVLSCRAVDWPPTFPPSNNCEHSSSSGHTIAIQLPKQKIQRIQKLVEDRKIKLTTVLHATLALSVTEYFKTYTGKHREALANLPPHIFVLTPMGDPSRRNELTNKLTMLGVRVPFGPGLMDKDPKSILNEIQESYSYETDSRIRHVSKIVVNLIGLLPPNLKPPILALCKGLLISHNPSFENPVTILGEPVTAARVCGSEFPTLSCITLFSLATRDEIQGTLIVTKQVLESYAEAKALANLFEKKLDDLYHDLIHMKRPKN